MAKTAKHAKHTEPVKKLYLCPVCCKEAMVVTQIDNKYYFVCQNCGTRRGPLPDKRHLAPPEV
ncbi:MAG: hypothetical protein QW751_01725 [Candidatus Aenigmatarchaeota archaeon]|nr:hypothetical protein [Candidatus Aenigmarchaeota archaeon]